MKHLMLALAILGIWLIALVIKAATGFNTDFGSGMLTAYLLLRSYPAFFGFERTPEAL